MTTNTVQVVCEENDPNKDAIASKLALVHNAVALDTLVAISCIDTETTEDVTVIAVITKDSGAELVQYAPIGVLLPPDSDYLQHVAPKLATYVVPENCNVEH